MKYLQNTVYSWNARGTVVQCPDSQETVLTTLCSVLAASPFEMSVTTLKQSLETLVFKVRLRPSPPICTFTSLFRKRNRQTCTPRWGGHLESILMNSVITVCGRLCLVGP